MPLIIEPDPDEPDFASVMIDAVIAGRSYRLVLDTGAARTQLDADDYLDGLAEVGEHTSSGAFGGRVTDPVVRIPGLTAGALRVGPLDITRSGRRAGSLLGMDVLSRYRCHFRLDARVLELDGLPAWPPWRPPL